MNRHPYNRIILFLALSLACRQLPCPAQTTSEHEYNIKSVFIFNFINFVDGLPFESRFSSEPENNVIHIDIMGKDPFGDAFDPLLKRTIKGRTLSVRKVLGPSSCDPNLKDPVATCLEAIKDGDILFICESEQNDFQPLLERLKDRNILTVSDTQNFLEKGGIINFLIKNNKVCFEINRRASRRANLTIRSKLLRLAARIIE